MTDASSSTQNPSRITAPLSWLLALALATALTSPFPAAASRDSTLGLADADDVYRLDTLNVEASDKVGAGWQPNVSTSATRMAIPLEDLPRTVSIITSEVISDLGEDRIDRALDFAGGVTRGNHFGGLTSDTYNLRGFTTTAMYRDGFSASGRNYGASPDPSTIERVEVLKGPSSGLFGRGDPGGAVNLVSKRPQPEKFTRVSTSAGSWDNYRGTLDLNHPLSAGGSILGRFNMALEDKGSFRDHVQNQRYVFAPSVSWQITERTLLVLDGQYIRNTNVYDRGIPTYKNEFGHIRIRNFYGEPGQKMLSKNHIGQAILEHQLHEDWKLRVATHYYRGRVGHGQNPDFVTEPGLPLPATPEIVPRHWRGRLFRWANLTNHFDIHGNFKLFGWEHQVLIGAEYEVYRSSGRQISSPTTNAYGVDIFDPSKDYGNTPPAITSSSHSSSRQRSYAFNFQDQVYFTQRLIGQVGVRHESVENRSQNHISGSRSGYDRDATVPLGGLLYKLTPSVSVFANASRSFKPNGTDSNGVPYDPETGVGYEAGTKLNAFDGRFSATLALFHITKQNVLTPHPDPSVIDSITVGEQRSQGFDIQMAGKVTDSLRVIAAYAFMDADVTNDNRANYQGRRLANVPAHSGSLFAVYELPHGVELGSTFTYFDVRRTSITSDFEMPSYSTVDLFLRWRVRENLNLTLNLNNVFDKEYYPRGRSPSSIVPGEPLNFKLTLNQKF